MDIDAILAGSSSTATTGGGSSSYMAKSPHHNEASQRFSGGTTTSIFDFEPQQHHHGQQQHRQEEPEQQQQQRQSSSSPSDRTGGSSKERTICAVCLVESDNHHIHYGALACFSCRAFFRRAHARGPAGPTYQCKKDKKCDVTLKNRKKCQRCRYEKCLAAGMNSRLVLTEDQKKVRFRKMIEKKGSIGGPTAAGGCRKRASSQGSVPGSQSGNSDDDNDDGGGDGETSGDPTGAREKRESGGNGGQADSADKSKAKRRGRPPKKWCIRIRKDTGLPLVTAGRRASERLDWRREVTERARFRRGIRP